MILLRLFIPYLYSLLLGITWGFWFKKKFSSSLAPAFMLHILLVLVCGLTFEILSIGIYGGISFAFIMFVIYVIKNRKDINPRVLMESTWNEGLMIFTIFYVLCFFINHDKIFTTWDEFTHWGMFLKEGLLVAEI